MGYNDRKTSFFGVNAGSDFVINRFADNGAFLGTAISISRATGDVTFESDIRPLGNYYSADNTPGIDAYIAIVSADSKIHYLEFKNG